MIKVNYAGLDSEIRKMRSVNSRLKSNVNRLGVESIKTAEKVMKDRVPVDTGELYESINNQGLMIGVTAPHVQAVEYGTHRSPAQPFIRPAIVEMEKYIEGNIGGVIDDTIQ